MEQWQKFCSSIPVAADVGHQCADAQLPVAQLGKRPRADAGAIPSARMPRLATWATTCRTRDVDAGDQLANVVRPGAPGTSAIQH